MTPAKKGTDIPPNNEKNEHEIPKASKAFEEGCRSSSLGRIELTLKGLMWYIPMEDHFMTAVELLDFTNTGAYAQHFPAIFHLNLSDGSYEFLQESVVSNFALPWKGCLWDLAESDNVSATSREIYKIAKRKAAEKMENVDLGEMYRSGKQLHIDSLLCLKATDGDGYIPVTFSMAYHYDPKKKKITRAFGSIREYTRPMFSMDPNDRVHVSFVRAHAARAMSR